MCGCGCFCMWRFSISERQVMLIAWEPWQNTLCWYHEPKNQKTAERQWYVGILMSQCMCHCTMLNVHLHWGKFTNQPKYKALENDEAAATLTHAQVPNFSKYSMWQTCSKTIVVGCTLPWQVNSFTRIYKESRLSTKWWILHSYLCWTMF